MLTSRWRDYVAFGCAALHVVVGSQQSPLHEEISPDFTFSKEWQVLGPFQIGTREATWGSDPLEYFGGFRALEFDRNATFKSSLAPNGTVSWSKVNAKLSYHSNQQANADLDVDFTNVDWLWLKEVYGWAAFQWQGWARGEIYIQKDNRNPLILHTDNVLEFWIDDTHYFGGDLYGYKKVPVTLRLDPGVHRLDVRLTRDVRSSGGIGWPNINVNFELHRSRDDLQVLGGPGKQIMISDVVGGEYGPLASPYCAIMVRNDAVSDIYIDGIEGMADKCELELLSNSSIRLVPGQTRPVAFQIECIPSWNRQIDLGLRYQIEGDHNVRFFRTTSWPRVVKNERDPHRVTFVHPGGMVSYVILRPPSPNIQCGQEGNLTLPVLVALHGAGLEADSNIVKHALDSLPDLCAWLIFPTGVVPWSGDDWHHWGLADIEAAVIAIPRWIETVEWDGPGVDVNKWLVSGHSNGGQGAWYVLTHRPDKVFAAAALSGYSSIQNYVPYTFWRDAEPGRQAVIQGALLPYHHELLMENAKDIPILQQHGSEDDNVPVYNARLMSETIDQAGASTTYFEVPGERHYWDGVLTTEPVEKFFEKHLNLNVGIHSPLDELRNFSIVTADPGDMGPKNGVEIRMLGVPGRLGRMDFTFDPLTGGCLFRVKNIWDWWMEDLFNSCDYIMIDGQRIDTATRPDQGYSLRKHNDGWRVADYDRSMEDELRTGTQLGAMDAIIRSKGAFQIVRHSNGTAHVALQISRNLCQYYTADTDITEDYDKAVAARGNVISIAVGDDLPQDEHSTHPIRVDSRGVSVRRDPDDDYPIRYDSFWGLKLFAIYLRPLPNQRLELVVWGQDAELLEMAARLVPMLTGGGQPDFVVGDRNMLKEGIEGTLALGFLNGFWRVSPNSFLT